TLQAIAQSLCRQQDQHGWIDRFAAGMELDQLSADDAGLSDDQATQLLQGLRSVDAQRRKDLQRELPPEDEAVSPDELEKLFNEERHWSTTAEQAQAALEP